MSRLYMNPNTPLGKLAIKYDKIIEQHQFSEREINIIRMYTECSDKFLYTSMYNKKENDSERYKEFKHNFHGSKELISLSKLMSLDKLINQFKTKDPLTIYRGTKAEYLKTTSIREDNTITLIPPTSTSADKVVCYDYLSTSDPLLLEIHLPKGYPALWLKPFSLYPKECEILLGSNSSFEILEESHELTPCVLAKKLVLQAKVSKSNNK